MVPSGVPRKRATVYWGLCRVISGSFDFMKTATYLSLPATVRIVEHMAFSCMLRGSGDLVGGCYKQASPLKGLIATL